MDIHDLKLKIDELVEETMSMMEEEKNKSIYSELDLIRMKLGEASIWAGRGIRVEEKND